MARWKSLLLAGAFGCWPALGFAQVNPPSPPATSAFRAPPAAATASVPAYVSGPTPVTTGAPARVTLSDRSAGRPMMAPGYGVPDVSGMPKAEPNMMYTGMGNGGGATPTSFMPGCGDGCGPQGLNLAAGCPVGVEPCGTTIQARGPGGWLLFGGVNFYRVRRSDPSILFQTTTFDDFGNLSTTSVQEDYRHNTGTGWFIGTGFLCQNGWFATVTYRDYTDTVHSDRVVNDGTDPNLVILYTGPGPLGSGAGGGDVPVGGFLDRKFEISWRNLDLMSGTVISPAECLDVIFSGGLRLSKLDQNYDAFIDFGDGTSNRQALRSETEGIGPRIGIETRVYPCWPFVLYAKAHSSLLLTHREETATTTFVGLETTNTSFARFAREEVLPTIELAVGAEASLFGGRVLIGGGYEFNYLFEAGSTYTEQSTNPRSARHVNLSIDGIVAHVTFLF